MTAGLQETRGAFCPMMEPAPPPARHRPIVRSGGSATLPGVRTKWLMERRKTRMPTLLLGLLVLALMLWLIKSFTRSDPRYLAMILATIGRTAGGILALAVAGFLGVRGELVIAVPLAVFGLSLLGWQPGRDLLAAYLDRRYPRWSEHVEQDPAAGRRTPASSGKMTEQEAYQ